MNSRNTRAFLILNTTWSCVPKKDAPHNRYQPNGISMFFFAGIVNAVSKAMGKEPKVLLYDPVALGLGKSGKAEGFPFR